MKINIIIFLKDIEIILLINTGVLWTFQILITVKYFVHENVIFKLNLQYYVHCTYIFYFNYISVGIRC